MNWLIFDVETTGFNFKKDFIISIGMMLWDDQRNERSEFYEMLNWTMVDGISFSISESSKAVHGIDEDMLKDAENSFHPVEVFLHAYDWISAFMANRDNCCINGLNVFNMSFDINMVRSNLQWMVGRYVSESKPGGGYRGVDINLDTLHIDRLNYMLKVFTKTPDLLFMDSMMVDRIFHFEENGIKVKHNLEDVGLRYGLNSNEHAHNAMYDVRRLANIFELQLKELKEKGIAINGKFEERLVKKWKREQERYGKAVKEDYYGLEMGPLEI